MDFDKVTDIIVIAAVIITAAIVYITVRIIGGTI